jgi:peptidyl-prolyl cis-trans isomerase A (cyclophilin A)
MKPQRVAVQLLFLFALVFASAAVSAAATSTQVVFRTSLGNFRANLFDDVAPQTVANFLKYVDDGDYQDTIIHRSTPNFVIQGGGHSTEFQPIPQDPPIPNEFSLPNVRATLAMAKVGGNPNSATSQWFINLINNSPFLDLQNGGFTVFGEILSGDMVVVDAIGALPRVNANFPGVPGPFQELPVLELPPRLFTREDLKLVVLSDIDRVPEPSGLLLLTIAASSCVLCVRRKRQCG